MQNSKLRKGDVILEGKGICKDFPGVWEHLVLDHVDISIKAGEIHTLLGEFIFNSYSVGARTT